ncbi:uncharacterized protein LOC143248090 [Tachypleus tridentatus]|uniref:uncharacterized protein LOC143248090 n=1 Tax=Tachypleus tridentatus TaxID=6853 RepID=UPI003FD29900
MTALIIHCTVLVWVMVFWKMASCSNDPQTGIPVVFKRQVEDISKTGTETVGLSGISNQTVAPPSFQPTKNDQIDSSLDEDFINKMASTTQFLVDANSNTTGLISSRSSQDSTSFPDTTMAINQSDALTSTTSITDQSDVLSNITIITNQTDATATFSSTLSNTVRTEQQENSTNLTPGESEYPKTQCVLEEGLECTEQIVCYGEGNINCDQEDEKEGYRNDESEVDDDVIFNTSSKMDNITANLMFGILPTDIAIVAPSEADDTNASISKEAFLRNNFSEMRKFYPQQRISPAYNIHRLYSVEQMADNKTDAAMKDASDKMSSLPNKRSHCKMEGELRCSPQPTTMICRGRTKCVVYKAGRELEDWEIGVIALLTVVGLLLLVVLLGVFYTS